MNTLIAVSSIAFLASALITPIVRMFAFRIGMVDRPDGVRKLHKTPVPLGGGVAICLAFSATFIGLLTFPSYWRGVFLENWNYYVGLLASAACICLVGLLDDSINLRGRQKLLGQIAAIAILISSGLVIRKFTIFEWSVDLGVLSIPFTAFWMLGAINALNLIDGVDGLATSIGLVFSLALATMAFVTGHQPDAYVALALAGSLAGFLIYNFPPAKMYLGDAGSMLIGLVVGALAIRSSLKGPATVALAAPTAVWAVLIFDVSMAIVRRKLTGRSVYTTDRGHLHHTLLQRGFSGTRIVVWVGMLCAFCGAGALASIVYQNDLLAIGSAFAVISTLVLTRFFGHSECALLVRSLKAFFISVLRLPAGGERKHEPFSSRLQGNREWDSLWERLTDYAERFDLSMVQLNVNLPALHEEYHAVWKRKHGAEQDQMWHATLPLVCQDGHAIGRLRLAGLAEPGVELSQWMSDLILGLHSFEEQVQQLAAAPAVHLPPQGSSFAEPHAPISAGYSAPQKLPVS
ncbi:MAG: undecaprenyl/decaprenyl-phosphate alpha-N-acetylglucosaminyl 1-phosphate transferase [Planctomycetaceae bacterium]|nr:undecaprenyl/decaprenyl-phosphate alpha-N-acetylglucosaminyl 1-phosphate transferase [Planctomycetaceae bacterium]